MSDHMTQVQPGTMALVRYGKLWRRARVLAITDGIATVQFPGTDRRHRIDASNMRGLSKATRNEWAA